MIKYYLKTAFRNLVRDKFYTIINIAGLSIGIAVAILLLSYVWFERSFDRFHSKSDQIYRIIQTKRVFEKETIEGNTSYGLVTALKEEFPEILLAGRLFHLNNKFEISYGSGDFIENLNYLNLADPEIFDIFDIDFILGNPKTAFQDPNSIILTEEESKKHFNNENPIGKFVAIRYQGADDVYKKLKVTGVVKAMPDNSHFHFKHLIPQEKFSWQGQFVNAGWYRSYIVLPKDFNPDNLTTKFPDFVKKYYTPGIEKLVKMTYDEWLNTGGYWNLKLQPLKQIHLGKYSFWEPPYILENKGNLFRVQIFTTIALFIILLACINYIILAIARSEMRAKEVGVRKVNGATRKQLIFQFLVESTLISLIAFFVAILMIKYFASSFNNLLEIHTSYDYTDITFILIALFVFTLIIGVFAGSYPAFFISRFKPIDALKGQLLPKKKGTSIRNSLVIFQFVISIILIISSISVYKQYEFMENKDLGFDKENIIIIKNLYNNFWMQGGDEISFAEKSLQMATFSQEISKFPSVINVSYLFNYPGLWGNGYNTKTVRLDGSNNDRTHVVHLGVIDDAYLDLFGLEMSDGKNFSKTSTTFRKREVVIINKAAANQLGFKNPVGKYIFTDKWETIINDEGKEDYVIAEKKLQIIGVFKNFHNRNLHEEIKPTIYFQIDDYSGNMLAIKFIQGQTPNSLDFLEKTWNKYAQGPLEYFFFDKEFENLYMKEKKLAQALTFFTLLAIFIGCLGIFGLAILATDQRTKEIGIRKVNGATIKEILFMLNKDFVKWVFIAFVIACPIAYFAMSKWLENFAFKTTLNWWIFALACGFTLVIALITVSWQSYKAATKNPVEALRDE